MCGGMPVDVCLDADCCRCAHGCLIMCVWMVVAADVCMDVGCLLMDVWMLVYVCLDACC